MPQSALTLIWVTVSLVVMSSGVEITSEWSQVPGQYMFKHVSIGQGGVWAVTSDDKIYYRSNTYHNELEKGDDWVRINGRLNQLDVGEDIVWGTDRDDNIYVRIGITELNPTGCKWYQINGELKHVSVSDKGRVWGVDSENKVYRRVGISDPEPLGTSWDPVGSRQLKVITVGSSGVWGTNSNGAIYFRTGTYGDPYSQGSGWKRTIGGLTYISSGNTVLGTIYGKVYILTGASRQTPTGVRWTQLIRQLNQVETWKAVAWGIDSGNRVYAGLV